MVRGKRRKEKSIESTSSPSKQTNTSIGKVGVDDALVDALKQPKTVQNVALDSGTQEKNVVNTPTGSSVGAGLEWEKIVRCLLEHVHRWFPNARFGPVVPGATAARRECERHEFQTALMEGTSVDCWRPRADPEYDRMV